MNGVKTAIYLEYPKAYYPMAPSNSTIKTYYNKDISLIT